jgi:hypothetical protein
LNPSSREREREIEPILLKKMILNPSDRNDR